MDWITYVDGIGCPDLLGQDVKAHGVCLSNRLYKNCYGNGFLKKHYLTNFSRKYMQLKIIKVDLILEVLF